MVKFIDNKDVKYKGYIYGKTMDELKNTAFKLITDSNKFKEDQLKKGIEFTVTNTHSENKTEHVGKIISSKGKNISEYEIVIEDN